MAVEEKKIDLSSKAANFQAKVSLAEHMQKKVSIDFDKVSLRRTK